MFTKLKANMSRRADLYVVLSDAKYALDMWRDTLDDQWAVVAIATIQKARTP